MVRISRSFYDLNSKKTLPKWKGLFALNEKKKKNEKTNVLDNVVSN